MYNFSSIFFVVIDAHFLCTIGFVTGAGNEDEDLGVLSNAAQSKIYNLEKKLAAAEKRVATLEHTLEEKTARKVKSLQRQNTMVEGELEIRDRRVVGLQVRDAKHS